MNYFCTSMSHTESLLIIKKNNNLKKIINRAFGSNLYLNSMPAAINII